MPGKVIILAGGGVKSATLTARAAREHETILLHCDYGQPSAGAEWEAVERQAHACRAVQAIQVALPPLARIEAASNSPALAPAPLRAQIPVMLAAAVQAALRHGAREVHVGLSDRCDATHLGRHAAGSADTVRELLYNVNAMIETVLPEKQPVRIEAPFIDLGGAEIVRLSARLEAPLDNTWTCESAGPHPCSRCEPCRARDRAFTDAAIPDPQNAPIARRPPNHPPAEASVTGAAVGSNNV